MKPPEMPHHGDFVKISHESERMWWRVSSVEEDRFTAELNNNPVDRDSSVKRGDALVFEPKDIIENRGYF